VHTYSGHENKVAKTLMQRVEAMGFKERILDVLVPTKEIVKVRSGKKETVKEKIFAGYIFVKMILDDESWLLARTTPGVTSFVGAQNKPTAVRDEEVEAIQKFSEMMDLSRISWGQLNQLMKKRGKLRFWFLFLAGKHRLN